MATQNPTGRPVIMHSDEVVRVPPGTTPNYNRDNPLDRLLTMMETFVLAAEREFYTYDDMQFLVPIRSLTLYGPSGTDAGVLDPEAQDTKTDFQKQNVKEFLAGDTLLTRGLVSVKQGVANGRDIEWKGPFLRISYDAGTTSKLADLTRGPLGEYIFVYLKVNDTEAPSLLKVPYNHRSARYDLEIWGYPGDDLESFLDEQGREALRSGELVVLPNLVRGNARDFDRGEAPDGSYMGEVSPDNCMHPLLPLHIELAWTTRDRSAWDSNDGANYHYEFNMIVRGWESYLQVGSSTNPHGGVGMLDFRTLMSNYYRPERKNELGRHLSSYNFDAFGSKDHGNRFEPFMAVDYMDLHMLNPSCGIGLHRHRDNSEIFFMVSGKGYMVVGDWCKMPERERCFEIRMLKSGHLAMLKGGNLHGLMVANDEPASLFMFGGYD